MKTHLNLANVYRNAAGAACFDLQLIDSNTGRAVATVSLEDGIQRRAESSSRLPVAEMAEFQFLARKLAAANAEKSVEWSYPSSDNAAAFGFAGMGCWTVQLSGPGAMGHAVRAFGRTDGRAEALKFARLLPCGWSPYFAKLHPLDVV